MDLQYLSLVYWCAKQAQSSNFSGSVLCCFDLGTLEQHVRCLSSSGLLLRCSCSTSLDSEFLQRRAALPVVETQKSPWNVSDRFVSRKNNEVTVWTELFSPEQQHANTHRLFIKLCWLMDKHAVSADRVVNIDGTSCRLLSVHQTAA